MSNREDTPANISLFEWQELLKEVAELRARVRELERYQQRQEDERGYAERGDRYQGAHPRRCACNRCLRIGL